MYSITDTLINNTSESVIYKFVSYKLYLFQQSYLDKPDKVFIKGLHQNINLCQLIFWKILYNIWLMKI